MSSMRDIFSKGKDTFLNATISNVAKPFIEDFIGRYATLGKFELDSLNKTIELHLTLKGEMEETVVKISKYEIIDTDSDPKFVFSEVITSKEWLTNLLSDKVVNKPIPLPKKYSGPIIMALK